MKKFSQIILSALTCCVIVCLSLTAAFSADKTYEIGGTGMSVSLPEDMLTITRSSKKTDSFFTHFALDYDETMDNFTDGNIYLQSIKQDSSVTVTVTMTQTEESANAVNYNDLPEAEINSIKNNYLKSKTYKSCAVTKYNGNTYLSMVLNTKQGKKTVQAQQAHTVAGGRLYVISLQPAKGRKLSDDNKRLMEDILSSATYTQENFFTENKEIIIFGSIILVAAAAVAVLFILLIRHFRNPVRKNKNLIHELAHEHRITETTRIPRKRISKKAVHDDAFLDEYEPFSDNGAAAASEKRAKTAEAAASAPYAGQAAFTVSDEAEGKADAPAGNAADDEGELSAQEQSAEEAPAVQGEENIDGGTDYFDDVPAEEELYSYTDVDSAVDDYSAAKRAARRSRAEESRQREGSNAGRTVFRALKAVGRGLLSVLQTLWMVICFIVIHLKYFCINVYRLIKRSIAKRRRRKEEEARRRRAEERRIRQREAEMNRRRQNANRGENDLIKVHSNGERVQRRYPQSTRQSARTYRR